MLLGSTGEEGGGAVAAGLRVGLTIDAQSYFRKTGVCATNELRASIFFFIKASSISSCRLPTVAYAVPALARQLLGRAASAITGVDEHRLSVLAAERNAAHLAA